VEGTAGGQGIAGGQVGQSTIGLGATKLKQRHKEPEKVAMSRTAKGGHMQKKKKQK